jgi:hypothetical protein
MNGLIPVGTFGYSCLLVPVMNGLIPVGTFGYSCLLVPVMNGLIPVGTFGYSSLLVPSNIIELLELFSPQLQQKDDRNFRFLNY